MERQSRLEEETRKGVGIKSTLIAVFVLPVTGSKISGKSVNLSQPPWRQAIWGRGRQQNDSFMRHVRMRSFSASLKLSFSHAGYG